MDFFDCNCSRVDVNIHETWTNLQKEVKVTYANQATIDSPDVRYWTNRFYSICDIISAPPKKLYILPFLVSDKNGHHNLFCCHRIYSLLSQFSLNVRIAPYFSHFSTNQDGQSDTMGAQCTHTLCLSIWYVLSAFCIQLYSLMFVFSGVHTRTHILYLYNQSRRNHSITHNFPTIFEDQE